MATKKTAGIESHAKKFEALRQKAIDSGLASEIHVSNDPFTLEEYGFGPEVKADVPTLESTLILQQAVTDGAVLDQSVALFGRENVAKIVHELDKVYDSAAASQILTGFIIEAVEHFWGQGASEVAGGFTSSQSE